MDDAGSEIDRLLATGRYSMFNPTSTGDLVLDYPELRKVESFSNTKLKPRQMLFVWHYACRASRSQELVDDKDRIRYAVIKAWGKEFPQPIMDQYLSRQWGAEVEAAIRDMRGFEFGPRVRMKLQCAQVMERVEALLGQPAPPAKEGWGARNEYFKAVAAGMALQRELLPYTEHNAFGISVVDEDEEEEGEVMDRLRSADR